MLTRRISSPTTRPPNASPSSASTTCRTTSRSPTVCSISRSSTRHEPRFRRFSCRWSQRCAVRVIRKVNFTPPAANGRRLADGDALCRVDAGGVHDAARPRAASAARTVGPAQPPRTVPQRALVVSHSHCAQLSARLCRAARTQRRHRRRELQQYRRLRRFDGAADRLRQLRGRFAEARIACVSRTSHCSTIRLRPISNSAGPTRAMKK
jgi:hypothetical protein